MINISGPVIMGIVNLSQDSFFSQSRCTSEKLIIEKVEQMLNEGADIIDIGACSTKPGHISITEDHEWELVNRALSILKKRFPNILLSIDTFRSGIVRKSYDIWGEYVVNDISAGEDDDKMLSTVGDLKLTYIAMHKKGIPLNMQTLCSYQNVVEEVHDYFVSFIKKARSYGIENIILDPGFGFAKDIVQNYELINGLKRIKLFNNNIEIPLLVGVSRKSMIYKLLGITPEESLCATSALHLLALTKGADILRVHDVKEAVQTVALYKALYNI